MILAPTCILLVALACAKRTGSTQTRDLPTVRAPKPAATALHIPLSLTHPSRRRRDFRRQGTGDGGPGEGTPARDRQTILPGAHGNVRVLFFAPLKHRRRTLNSRAVPG